MAREQDNEMGQLWSTPSLEEQVALAEQYGVDTLHYCRDLWAVRHYWMDQRTGEKQRARCNRWECLYCGPRKVNLWRQLVKLAEPTLFLTLSKAGTTVEQARRALTTFLQALRRGSTGKGLSHVGARQPYPVEYFAVLERHQDFERNGFHWHLLLKGVERIPYKEVIQPLWMSATHFDEQTGEGAKIGYIRRVRNTRSIGYVTKYLTKALSLSEKGVKEVQRERVMLVQGEDGQMRPETYLATEQVTSKAHRICYSQNFFPERVADLRRRLFAGIEHEVTGQDDHGKPVETEQAEHGSQWVLYEHTGREVVDVAGYKQQRYAELAEGLEAVRARDPQGYQRQKQAVLAQIWQESRGLVLEEYRQLKRRALVEALEDARPLSRRVINVWAYQRQQMRSVNNEQER